MKSLRVLATFVALMSLLSACGKPSEGQKSQDDINRVNAEYIRMKSIRSELEQKGIVLESLSENEQTSLIVSTAVLQGMTAEDLKHTKDLLNEYVADSQDVLNVAGGSNVAFNGNRDKLLRSQGVAQKLAARIDETLLQPKAGGDQPHDKPAVPPLTPAKPKHKKAKKHS